MSDKVPKNPEKHKKYLSKNAFNPYTRLESEMVLSLAFRKLTGKSKDILLLLLLKRKFTVNKKKKTTTYQQDNIKLTYIELQSPPLSYAQETIRRSFEQLRKHGFVELDNQGGAYHADCNTYRLIDKWRNWKKDDNFDKKEKDCKRGYQGRKPTDPA